MNMPTTTTSPTAAVGIDLGAFLERGYNRRDLAGIGQEWRVDIARARNVENHAEPRGFC